MYAPDVPSYLQGTLFATKALLNVITNILHAQNIPRINYSNLEIYVNVFLFPE
jgi:hypothetical protein